MDGLSDLRDLTNTYVTQIILPTLLSYPSREQHVHIVNPCRDHSSVIMPLFCLVSIALREILGNPAYTHHLRTFLLTSIFHPKINFLVSAHNARETLTDTAARE
jgi:hypothetical protein